MKQLQALLSFSRYLARPVLPQRIRDAGGASFFLTLFVFSFIADLGLDWLSSREYFSRLFHVADQHAVEKKMITEGLLFSALVAGLLVPVVEEIRSRYYITSFQWNYTVLPLNCCVVLQHCFNLREGPAFYGSTLLALALASTLYVKLKRSRLFRMRLMRIYASNYGLFFYLSACSFGAMHMGNYQLRNFIPLLSFVLVLPQLFAGLVLGYVRIVMGIKWSIVFHGLHNLFAVAILFSKA